MRNAKKIRKTNETEISAEINLDGLGKYKINTGIPFFDHMLIQFAVHGLFDLTLSAKGDLAIDPHHTIEDCALVLGEAIKQALGDKGGITRTASAIIPMDEALSQVVVDFSGRPYAIIKTEWNSSVVGGIDTTLIDHFLESLASACGANLHVVVHSGRNNHHIAESIFKAIARAFSEAVQIDARRKGAIPSSKGVL